jgi:hypothetical protein
MNHHERLRTMALLAFVPAFAACGSEPKAKPEPHGAAGGSCVRASNTGGSGSTPGNGVGRPEQAGVAGTSEACVERDNVICAPSGFPFVQFALAFNETCPGPDCHPPNPSLTQPEPGALCLAGNAPDFGSAGFPLVLFRGWTQVLQAFDATALGITKLSFAIDSPPIGGLLVDASVVIDLGCEGRPPACLMAGFALPRITDSGTITVSLGDFLQRDNKSPYQTLDTSSLGSIEFSVGAGPYDFCVSNFKFLDECDQEVTPPP